MELFGYSIFIKHRPVSKNVKRSHAMRNIICVKRDENYHLLGCDAA
jgi:hypothetical protein